MDNLISIIIPTYNRAYLIRETLDSIVNQTYTNWECIVIDDGSTDNSEEVLKSYTQSDLRFQYHKRPSNKKKGANSCRNYGYEICQGDFIKWFDSDDIMHPDFLKKQLELLLAKKELDFCATFSETFVGQKNNVVGYHNPEIFSDNQNSLFNYIVGKLIFLTPSPLWKRKFLEKKNLFDETLWNAHETDFNFARLIEQPKFQYINEALFFVRRGHDSIDRHSEKDTKGYLSMFKYYQKVFLYLKTNKNILEFEERKILAKFILYKQLMILNNLRKVSSAFYFSKELKILLSNIFKVDVRFINLIKILFGIFLMIFFKKGYRFFDLDELKIAKHCKK